VEQVSWDDCQGFLNKLNEEIPGLELSLPSEAQWEYACRAGSQTAIYTGDIEIVGESNAPALDPIAWYGGNSGVGFELENGYDSSEWPERQYKSERSGTHPVKQKIPNAWGLYDMLGNVWEWTADAWHENYEGAQTDGSVWQSESDEAGARRVIRGGSWGFEARYCRSACRGGLPPVERDDGLGFRPARVQS
jgi:formylglycine-generating enzyme required for sulfatase activity